MVFMMTFRIALDSASIQQRGIAVAALAVVNISKLPINITASPAFSNNDDSGSPFYEVVVANHESTGCR
jgi:hypothetical protein